jgi:hypothetical protein
MNERNLNEGQWEDRKQWSLGVGQRRITFWNRYIYIHTYIHTHTHTHCTLAHCVVQSLDQTCLFYFIKESKVGQYISSAHGVCSLLLTAKSRVRFEGSVYETCGQNNKRVDISS